MFRLPPWFRETEGGKQLPHSKNGSAVDHAHFGAFSLYANDAKSFSGRVSISELPIGARPFGPWCPLGPFRKASPSQTARD